MKWVKMMKEHSVKRKHREQDEKNNLIRRLNIIEGQVKGVKQMIEDDRYCDDVLIQISAITKSLKSLGSEVFKNHLSTCVVKDIQNNHLEVIDDVMDLVGKLNR